MPGAGRVRSRPEPHHPAASVTGIDGDTFKRTELMDRYGVQINKTTRNTVLFMTNIGTTRSSVAYLVEILVKIAQELDDRIGEMCLTDQAHHERAVQRLTTPSAPLPDFSGFHTCFLERNGQENQGSPSTPDGDLRRAFYLGYDDSLCEYLTSDEVEEKMESGQQVVSATFVTPYPPGFPRPGPRPGLQSADPVLHAQPGHHRNPRIPATSRLSRLHRKGPGNGRDECASLELDWVMLARFPVAHDSISTRKARQLNPSRNLLLSFSQNVDQRIRRLRPVRRPRSLPVRQSRVDEEVASPPLSPSAIRSSSPGPDSLT